jgi:hypothetical protein
MAQAVVFGLGSMFNHSRDPNIGWTRDLEKLVVIYRTLRDIPIGEELCEFIVNLLLRWLILEGISYGDRLTFKDSDAPSPSTDGDGSEILNNIHID